MAAVPIGWPEVSTGRLNVTVGVVVNWFVNWPLLFGALRIGVVT
jgi:hypothetical protein